MSDEYPDPSWTCPKCGGRVERPFVSLDIAANRFTCHHGARDADGKPSTCGHTWEPRNVNISTSLSAALDILADSIDRERGKRGG